MTFADLLPNRLKRWVASISCSFYLWLCLILILIYLYVTYEYKSLTRVVVYEPVSKDISCYHTPETVLQSVEDENFKPQNKTLYFVESSCKGGLNSRQACAVESTAAANPNWSVVVLFTGPLSSTFHKGSSFAKLTSMPNVQFRRVNVVEFSKGTPLHPLFLKGIVMSSSHPVVHTSDILRILVLYKFGGIYLDLDVIVMKSFDPLPKNFVAKQWANEVASGILGFSTNDIGKKFTQLALSDLAMSYQPNSWAGNGPALIHRTLVKICDANIVYNMTAATCKGMDVLPSDLFFPIYYPYWKSYYEDKPPIKTKAYMHHVWNALGSNEKILSNSMFARLAAQYCPKTYELYGEQFGY